MCEAYVAAEAAGRPMTSEDPVFAGLVMAAGSAARVTEYCDGVLSASAQPSEGAQPSRAHASKPHPPKPHPSKSHESNSDSASANSGQGTAQDESPAAAQSPSTSHTPERNVVASGLSKTHPDKVHPNNK